MGRGEIQFQFQCWMGKIKTKYPLELELDFMLFLETSELIRESYSIILDSGSLEYSHLRNIFQDFLNAYQIAYEAYMFFQSVHVEKEELVSTEWSLSFQEIEEHNRFIIIKVKSHTQHMKDLFYEQLEDIITRVSRLEGQIHSVLPREEDDLELRLPCPSPMMHHAGSISQAVLSDKDLDIGILFSEPIFDEKKHKEANLPVDFRSELQRLYSALNNSYKPEITVECQIATKQHLKHLISYKKPKILHIISHGSKDGELEFEDDSKFSIGALTSISTNKIRELLKEKRDSMPSLVFINSCHSEIIGKVFFEAGAKYCIMIDSQDKIDDEAAQIFSENFYRNIFRGEKVGTAFKEAQDNVKIKHNSSGCCCRHTARETHKAGCRWLQLCETMGEHEAHRMYHIPSQKCSCELRNINQHDLTCEWASSALFAINNDFRILDNGVQRFPKKKSQLPKYLPSDKKKQMLLICCCFNFEDDGREKSDCKQTRIPHSESNKFKMLPADFENTEPLYELQKNFAFRTQIIDFSAPELVETHEKVSNLSVMGRQQDLYEFMKSIKDYQYNFFFLYGHPGVGKTSFAIKSATYLIERRVFELYFFVDLYDIKDRDMFRSKFNEVTMLGYPFNKSSMNDLRNKLMIIIFDNVDEFFLSAMQEFKEEIACLKKEFQSTKFILTCRENNLSVLENESFFMENHTLVRELKVLDENTAAKALFAKIRNYLDISISYFDIREIVASKQELRIPKVIENLSHSFSHTKGKIKLSMLKQKVSELGNGDLASTKLIEENLNILRGRYKESYDLLIFISQFSQGIDKNDFNILGTYDRPDNRIEGYDSAIIDIPIDRNWRKRLVVLFEKTKETTPLELTTAESESDALDSIGVDRLDRRATTISDKSQVSHQHQPDPEEMLMFEGESYFLEEISRNRFVVRRFIRDFIWNKDRSDQNYYTKHIFVAYTAVMLDIYLNFLVSEKYIHEELLEYSDISQAGIFKYKDNNYVKANLTESIRYVEDYNSRFERMLKQQPALREKIRSSDPSVFIANHKLDFLHIYGYDWSKIYEYLLKNKKREASVLINYLQRLIILIPTAMKIANMEESLIKYTIRQSIRLLGQIRRYSKPAHNLMLTLKLKLMKASSELEKGDESLIPNTEFQKDFHKTDLDGVDCQLLKSLQKQFNSQIEVLEVYLEYVKAKEFSKSTDSSLKMGDRIVETVKRLEEWLASPFEEEVGCEILAAKRKLILSMIYNKILEASVRYPSNFKIINCKNNAAVTSFVKTALDASKVFSMYRMTKLDLRAKMIAISINWEQLKTKIKHIEFSRELERQRLLLRECEDMYEDKKNNLIGLTIFDSLMKRIKKEMKERVWQESANNFVVMKAVPLLNKNSLILENIVRKKPKYRKDMESIFKDAEIDLSLKVEILTEEKFAYQTKRQSSILLLRTNFKSTADKVYLICEDSDLKEHYLEINADFAKEYPLGNTKLLIIMGANAGEGFRKLSQLYKAGPSIMSITTKTSNEFDEFEECVDDLFDKSSSLQLRKAIEQNTRVEDAEIEFAKDMIKSIINPKNYRRGIKEISIELLESSTNLLKEFKIEMRESSKEIIKMSKGKFMDMSPGFRKAHNVDVEFRNPNVFCVYRKWKEINEVFKEFNSKRETKYLQICGGNGIGKSTFIQELGRMCIERGLFQSGVYILNGKEVEKQCDSDFEGYIAKMSEASTGMFNLQSFNKYADSNFLIMIDDFHLVKPRSNGRYNLFLKKLIEKKVNVIFVTHESYNLREQFPKLGIKSLKIERMEEVELDIFAYSLFKPDNTAAIEDYEEQRKKRRLNCVEITQIYEKYLYSGYKDNYLKMPEDHLRKMISNRQ